MKTLTLIRHAKSSWDDFALSDFDRPLNKRGKSDLPVMGERLANEKVQFDLIISSPAMRTTQTITHLLPYISYPVKNVLWDDRLYLCSLYEIEELIESLDDNWQSVALVFHNPAITELSNHIQKDKKILNVPTCGILSVKIEVERWENTFSKPAKLNFFLTPKTDKKYTA